MPWKAKLNVGINRMVGHDVGATSDGFPIRLEPPKHLVDGDLVTLADVLLDRINIVAVSVDALPTIETTILASVLEVRLHLNLVLIHLLQVWVCGSTKDRKPHWKATFYYHQTGTNRSFLKRLGHTCVFNRQLSYPTT